MEQLCLVVKKLKEGSTEKGNKKFRRKKLKERAMLANFLSSRKLETFSYKN
jgi:hypothetical protein